MAEQDRGDIIAHDELQIARDEWDRLQFAIDNGHGDYVEAVRRNFRYYKGDGGQWSDADRQYMESVQGRKCIEINGILPSVETAVGEQIATRVDITFKPARGQASAETATILSKIAKHDMNKNGYPRKEKQVFKDGLIKRRGYFDVRMNFDDNVHGDVQITEVDPITVIPDPASTSYDPKEWPGVSRIHWLSLDQIEGMFGMEARKKTERTHEIFDESPYNELFRSVNGSIDNRYGFSDKGVDSYLPMHRQEAGEMRYRVIERQFYKMSFTLHWIDQGTGEIYPVPENMSKEEYVKVAIEQQYTLKRMNRRRVFWRVCTGLTVLHDEISPYRTFTLIPFFYLFDYGHTLGMVDNVISPQDLQNKSISAELHILTSLSNSGWMVPKNKEKSTLTNMTVEDLRDIGMKNGVVIEYDTDIGAPSKIMPNKVPTGHDRLSEKGEHHIKTVSGINDAERGMDSPEVSGVAISAKQFQAKLQLSDPLDNLQFTRILLGRKILELRQDFSTAEQVFMISDRDKMTGKEQEEQIVINQVDPIGRVLNDITIGDYEVEVSTSPMAATHEEGQFKQAMEMRSTAGVAIPDHVLIRLSNLDDKYELADQLSQPNADPLSEQQREMLISQIKWTDAKTRHELAKATNTNIQALFGSVNAGVQLATVPGVAPLADELALSAGFQDANAAPIIPEGAPAALPAPADAFIPDENTSPNYPPIATNGINEGIEGG